MNFYEAWRAMRDRKKCRMVTNQCMSECHFIIQTIDIVDQEDKEPALILVQNGEKIFMTMIQNRVLFELMESFWEMVE